MPKDTNNLVLDIGDFSGDATNGAAASRQSFNLGRPYVCPLLDQKSMAFCSLDAKMCPYVGFDFSRCKKYEKISTKMGTVAGINPYESGARQKSEAIQEQILSILNSEKEDEDENLLDDSGFLVEEDIDFDALAKMEATLKAEIGKGQRSSRRITDNVVDKLARKLAKNISWAKFSSDDEVRDRAEKLIAAYFHQVYRVRPGVASKQAAAVISTMFGMHGVSPSQRAAKPEDYGDHFRSALFNQMHASGTDVEPRGDHVAAPHDASSYVGNDDDLIEPVPSNPNNLPRETRRVDRGSHTPRSVGSRDSMTQEEFEALISVLDKQVVSSLPNHIKRLIRVANSGRASNYTRARAWKIISAAHAKTIENGLLKNKQSKVWANALENAVKMGKITPDMATKWRADSTQASEKTSGLLNKILDNYTTLELKKTTVHGVDVPYIEARRAFPTFTPRDIYMMRTWDAIGFDVLSKIDKYGKRQGALHMTSILARFLIQLFLAARSPAVPPEMIRFISNVLPLEPLLYGLARLAQRDLPKLARGKDEVSYMAREKYRSGHLNAGRFGTPPNAHSNVAVLHQRTVASANKKTLAKGKRGAKAKASDTSWRKSHI